MSILTNSGSKTNAQIYAYATIGSKQTSVQLVTFMKWLKNRIHFHWYMYLYCTNTTNTIYLWFSTNVNEAGIRYWYLCFSTNKCKDFIKDINCEKKVSSPMTSSDCHSPTLWYRGFYNAVQFQQFLIFFLNITTTVTQDLGIYIFLIVSNEIWLPWKMYNERDQYKPRQLVST